MKKLFALLFLPLAFMMSACSGGSDDSQQEADTTPDVRTIDVYGIDQMKYVVKEEAEGLQTGETYTVNGEDYFLLTGINATTGEEMKLALTTISKIPATAMSHNWILLDQGADAQAFNMASIKAKDNGYIAPDMTNMMLANTAMAAGGETVEVEFAAPDSTGDYEYLCTFPGHFSGGMKGVLSVQE